MDAIAESSLEAPRPIVTEKPVRLVLVGGFLGAGKTTALTALARELTGRGLRVGVITNDQAAHLVDTQTVRQAGFPASEVAGGCFCCRFSDLADAAQQVISEAQPDVLLCEPVGSCTDMAATVIAPLHRFYPAQFAVAPFCVLVDPRRVEEILLGATPAPFVAEAAYIFAKQLEEADEIVLNKIDRLTDAEAERLADALTDRFGKPVRRLSASRGDGIAAWADALLTQESHAGSALRAIDYDTYAAGEAALGWLNATADVTPAATTFDPQTFAQETLNAVLAACSSQSAARDAVPSEIAHVKLTLSDDAGDAPGGFLRANLTTASGQPEFHGEGFWPQVSRAKLVLNARVQSPPERLEDVVRGALARAAAHTGAAVHVQTLQCFSPAYPRPPYRIPAAE